MYDYIAGERVHTERADGGMHSTKSVVESYLTIVSILQVGVPMRSVQVEGMYSNTGRAQAAEGSLMWDADGDKNMKLGLKGQLDKRGKTKKVQLGLDLPFVDKVRAEWISKPQHNTTRHSTTRHDTMQRNTFRSSTVQCIASNTTRCDITLEAMQYNASQTTQHSTVQYNFGSNAVQCIANNTARHSAI